MALFCFNSPLQAQSQSVIQFWLDRESSYKRLSNVFSWHWILWRLLTLKPMLNDYSRCVVIWQQNTEQGVPV